MFKVKRGIVTKVENEFLLKSMAVALKADANIFAEVGISRCGTTTHLLNFLLHQEGKYKIVGVDISEKSQIKWDTRIKDYLSPSVTGVFYKGNSWEMANKVEDKSLAWCFIDANHMYEACAKDIQSWRKKIANNGLLLFHDTGVRLNLLGLKNTNSIPRRARIGVLRALIDNMTLLYKSGFEPFMHLPVSFFEKSALGIMVFRRKT